MISRPSIFTLALAGVGLLIWAEPGILNGPVAKGRAEQNVPAALNAAAASGFVQLAQRAAADALPEVIQGTKPSDQRGRLEERERALERREALLQAAEKRLAEKIAELKLLQTSIDRQAKDQPAKTADAKTAGQDREEQLRRLVRVYESMRPREAARIFEQMDQGLLMDVAGRMKTFKLAPVLAAMDPKKATQLTAELAKRKPAPRPAPAPGIGG